MKSRSALVCVGAMLGMVLVATGCRRSDAPSAATSATDAPQTAAADVAAPAQEETAVVAQATAATLRVTYRMSIPFGQCKRILNTYVKSAAGYRLESSCETDERPAIEREVTREEFDGTVYLAARRESEPELGEVAVEAIAGAPAGTSACYQSPEGAKTVCVNDAGIITFSAFDGYKYDPPKMDANRSYELVGYTAE